MYVHDIVICTHTWYTQVIHKYHPHHTARNSTEHLLHTATQFFRVFFFPCLVRSSVPALHPFLFPLHGLHPGGTRCQSHPRSPRPLHRTATDRGAGGDDGSARWNWLRRGEAEDFAGAVQTNHTYQAGTKTWGKAWGKAWGNTTDYCNTDFVNRK